ncbi:MAG: hypothetical protein B7Z80_10350 [Rhodospirillales bacterium 20-64-7]|nr:MAG: hypothetical protein B7Z80_10350 [Rhodospirillales bacterium 20-64-7]
MGFRDKLADHGIGQYSEPKWMRIERQKRRLKRDMNIWTRIVAASVLIPLIIFLSAFLIFVTYVIGLTIWHAI